MFPLHITRIHKTIKTIVFSDPVIRALEAGGVSVRCEGG